MLDYILSGIDSVEYRRFVGFTLNSKGLKIPLHKVMTDLITPGPDFGSKYFARLLLNFKEALWAACHRVMYGFQQYLNMPANL